VFINTARVRELGRTLESPIQVPETQSAFHLHAQQNAFRGRGVRQQRRSFAPLESIAETQPPTPTGFAEIVSDDFPIFHMHWIVPFCAKRFSGA
jgi:hypothetical protein